MSSIRRKPLSLLLIPLVNALILTMDFHLAWYGEFTGKIQGRVFVDEDGDVLYDHGETLLEGVEIELTSENAALLVVTERDGTFSVDVGYGHWQTMIRVPDGYYVSNDPSRNVQIGSEHIIDVFMDFALTRVNPSEREKMLQDESPEHNTIVETLTQLKPTGSTFCGDDVVDSQISCTAADNPPGKKDQMDELLGIRLTKPLQPVVKKSATVLIFFAVFYTIAASFLWGARFSRKQGD